MRTSKRYSNVTITKRVDYESGRHHTLRTLPEPCVCRECGASYVDRRWTNGEAQPENIKHQRFRKARLVICNACRQQLTGEPRGFVRLEGGFLSTHRTEVERLLRNEAARASADNPLARIMKWREDGNNRLIVETTTEHLAQRLGHALEKAFCGTVKYQFSHNNKLARVHWCRD